ncbi:dTDP-4-dehydrorhamnose reductase [Candidatus Parcubacteria bacterium]|nr:dTDP-4-dehydrorhamnose reductase [Candidatus Parcubacteria bacterium]
MQTVAIFGAAGQLGTALLRVFTARAKVIGFDRTKVDITDRKAVASALKSAEPDIVINAAAYNNVERAEEEIERAYAVNTLAPFYLAREAARYDATYVHISTDYVFDGTAGPYSESAAPHPLNVYGASKLAGETLIRIAHPKHYLIRTSALFGSAAHESKKNFVQTMIEKGRVSDTVRVVGDQTTVPTSTHDLAGAIRELLDRKAPSGTYHIVNGGAGTWADFAEEIFRQAHMPTVVSRVSTETSGTHVQRPCESVLAVGKLNAIGITLPPWQDALQRYLEEIGIQ